jgi:YD repeat-containing protein
MDASRPASFSVRLFCAFLIYLLLLSLIPPFHVRRVEASPSGMAAGTVPDKPPAPSSSARRDGELLIRFRESASEQDRQTAVESRGARRGKRLRGEPYMEKLVLEPRQDVEALTEQLRQDAAVEFVEPNFIITKAQAVPDDAQFGQQWALRNEGQSGGAAGADINAIAAWQSTTGKPTTVIAVIDSGIDFSHPDLNGNQWTNPTERVNKHDDDRNGYVNDLHGWDWVKDTGEVRDEQGHGTAVAGVIAAQGNNQTGISGVMWRASLMSLRVLDASGTGDVASAVEAIDYAVAMGAQIINCSWGTSEPSQALRDAIHRAAGRGIVVVASAGNDGRDLDSVGYYPAAFDLPNLISVAATDSQDHLAGWSNRGATRVSVAAPGVDVLTTRMGGGYQTLSGSSLAAPFVSGIAGLVKTQRPFLKANATREAILSNVRSSAELSGKVSSGGIVNAGGALSALVSMPAEQDMRDENGNGIDDETEANPGNGEEKETGGGGSHGGGGGNDDEKGVHRQPGVPGEGLPNLDEVRKLKNVHPKAPEPIKSNICYECERCVECGGGGYNEPPVAVIGGPYSGTVGAAIPFDGSGSYDLEGWINSYQWDFGDGTTGGGAWPLKSYAAAGTYTVTLTVRDNNFQYGLASTTVTVSGASNLPSPWASQDIGSVGYAGSADFSSGSFTAQGSGADIWDTADGLRYIYQPWTGDGQIVARVAAVGYTDAWAKAGVMIRESLTNNSRHASMFVTPGMGTAFQWRDTPGGYSGHAGSSGAAPYWVKLTRLGNSFSGYASADGVNWTLIGTIAVGMASTVYIGMAVTSHNNAALCAASFDNVGVGGAAATNNAAFISQSAPTTLIAGQTANVSVTMQNTGTTTWATAEGYKLGSQNPQDNGTWGTGRVALPTSVAPGVQTTFTFPVTAPPTPGTYNFQWRMLREGVEWFGGYTVNVTITVSNPPSTGGGYTGSNLTIARLDAANRTGSSDHFSGNHSWSVPLVTLSGRSGLDLGLSLSYNSLVWTRHGSAITFDADQGFPGPGFRLGFPIIEPRHYNELTGRYGYLLITPSGAKVELRQVNGTAIYEAADSSYLQLIDYGSSLLVRTTDGTQLSYTQANSRWVCTQIKDRNGNYISATYHTNGRLANLTDTLGRVISFTYDGSWRPLSIVQTWNRAGYNETHEWARFGYGDLYVAPGFSGLTVNGPQNAYISVLTQVSLDDGSRYNFEYNPSGQVAVIRHYAFDSHQRRYTIYGYYANGADVPRVTERRDWAEHWNGNAEAVTSYGDEGNGTKTVTLPDRTTVHKEMYSTMGWARGLVTAAETWSGGVRQRWTTTALTQDDPNAGYPINPRPTEVNVYDAQGNRRRMTIEYASVFGLPVNVREYASDGATVLRRTETSYRSDAAYLDRRIIGLPAMQQIFEGESTLVSKVESAYDWTDAQSFVAQSPSVGHDTTNYGAGFITGRGNLTGVRRFNVFAPADENQATWIQRLGYNVAGSVVVKRSALNHTTSISYTDSYSDAGNGRNTLAYPTTVTDPSNAAATAQYNYDMGVVVRTQDPKGAFTTKVYDTAGRVERTTNGISGAYTRYVYAQSGDWVQQFTTVETGQPEAYSITVSDGAGRLRATAGDHPGSAGGYRAQFTYYDVMGRVSSRTNPTEITGGWTPYGDDAAGWVSTQFSYDWKGRLTRTTNTDSTYSEVAYGGCGCAGGEIVTTMDEVGRKQRITSDVLGRQVKVEDLNWNGGVYRTITNTYNARDQITQTLTQDAASGASQTTTIEYDGYGRVWKRKAPIQLSPTVIEYNADDTPFRLTDARGASSTYTHNSRGLVTNITYTAASGVEASPSVAFDYDAAGNRLWMTDGAGRTDYQYNQLSQLTQETRQFSGLAGSYWLTYQYNLAGQLKSITDYNNSHSGYNYDRAGRLTAINASGYGNVTQFASNMTYRASGALKGMTYGNGVHVQMSYNSRLLPTRYDVTGLQYYYGQAAAPSGSTYSYYADGRVSYAQDIRDAIFDRAYQYDHVGRIQEAMSGSQARGGTAADGPYRQSYGYDAWDNITTRNNRLWSQSLGLDTTTYTNNRRQGWGYDAEGNITLDTWEHTYDAANGKVRSRKEGFEGAATYPAFDYYITTIEQGYDGDGRVSKRSERRQHEDENGVQPEELTTTYYLRSTVLGGAVVNEIGGKRNIYAGGQKIAEQWEGATDAQFWHINPVTGSWVEAYGAFGTRKEMDPLGADVGTVDPFVTYGTPNYYDMMAGEPLFMDGGNPFDMRGGCTLDGMPISCSEASRRLETGSAVFDTMTTVNITYRSGRRETIVGRTTLPPGLDVRFTGQNAHDAAFGFRIGSILGGFNMGVYAALANGFASSSNSLDGRRGGVTGGFAFFFAPQDNSPTVQNATPNQQARFNAAYKNLLGVLSANGGKNPCAELFGGYDKAMKALNESKFSFKDLGAPLTTNIYELVHAATKGKDIFINSQGGFMAEKGEVPTQLSMLLNTDRPNERAFVTRATVPGSFVEFRNDVRFAAFVLLHELGHRRGIFGKDNKDGIDDKNGTSLEKTARNNQKILDACFQ